MKKVLSLALCTLMLLAVLAVPAFASADPGTVVYVTISDDKGNLVMMQEPITVTDKNNDGKFTLDETLFAAHEAKYEGGAAAGYASSESDFGLSLYKLWGVEKGVSYGYAVNNVASSGLSDEIKNGDYLTAYIYTDLTAWSDTYCYFNEYTVTAKKGDEIALTLISLGYDPTTYAPTTSPVKDAVITIDGVATEYKTDADGKVTIKLDKKGDVVISAKSDSMTLVPPVCKATVESSVNVVLIVCIAVVAVVAIAGVTVVVVKRKKA